MKTLKYFFQAIIIYFCFGLSKLLGLKLSRSIFSFIFRKIGPLVRSNKVSQNNLSKFSKKISKKEINKITSGMWNNYGMTFIEYMFLKSFKEGSSHIKIKGEKILSKFNSNKNPVIFISGHFANFELMSMELTKRNINLATIYRPLNNFFLNPLMESLRKKYICKNQIKKGRSGVKDCMNYIKRKHSIALMIDQRVSEGQKIKFFGHEASTTTLPAQLAIKYNLSIVPIFIERKNDNSFEMHVYEPIKISNYENKMKISKKLNLILEKMIKKNPHQWIWTHARWK